MGYRLSVIGNREGNADHRLLITVYRTATTIPFVTQLAGWFVEWLVLKGL
jgi:hypothetical protein